ncbi:hypothetical protein S101395_03430 [Bacillus sonorensis]|uniref:Uncharacterized protein n=1 Tax=Bacillus sonorensis TaxID=119858 RepID=A0ABN5AGS6_9BACI|nr:hypothetical protein S101395_03430 [Bacillus sonorensis]
MDSPHSRRYQHTKTFIKHKTLIHHEEILIPRTFCYGDVRVS